MIKRTAYILIGDDNTGKTTFQKHLIFYLCDKDKFRRLECNWVYNIIHPESPRKLNTISIINRSVQEKLDTYKSIEKYFNENHFKDADITILSSHSKENHIDDIEIMINNLKAKYYNVEAVFFTNCLNDKTAKISKLNWDGRNIGYFGSICATDFGLLVPSISV